MCDVIYLRNLGRTPRKSLLVVATSKVVLNIVRILFCSGVNTVLIRDAIAIVTHNLCPSL